MDNRILQIAMAVVVALNLVGCQLPPRSYSDATPLNSVAPVARHIVVRNPTEVAQTERMAEETSTKDAPADASESLAQINCILADNERTHGSDLSSDRTAVNALSRLATANAVEEESAESFVQTTSVQVCENTPSMPPVGDEVREPEAFPVDLPTILQLAGGRNWAVQLAGERIHEAQANVTAAEAMWLPNLNVGIGATKHDGQIQATTGEVLDVSRHSLFVGGGARVANAPLAGGAGGPARMFVDLSIADALFKPLVARQLSCAAHSRQSIEFNDAQLAGALAYFDLVAAQGEVSIVRQNLADAEDLQTMTQAFVSAGKASPAEVARVHVIVANQRQALVAAELKIKLASNELIRIVRLDPTQLSTDALLYSADDHLLAIELISETADLDSLILQGQQSRPEVAEQHALAQAELANARGEELRPFIPHLNLGLSGGGFGGGAGSDIDKFSGRSDLDAQLIWEVRNLGFGENAARCRTCSKYRQAVFRSHQMQDQIAVEVKNAWHRVEAGRQRIELSRENVTHAAHVLEQNVDRIRGLEGQPLENIQALNAVSNSRLAYLRAIVDYNKAQAALLRAVGCPVANGL